MKLYQTKQQVGYCEVTFPIGDAGVCQADYLTNVGQVIPDWFKIPFWGELKLFLG